LNGEQRKFSAEILAALNAYLQRDFAKEWPDSLKVKDQRSLGEEEIARLLR
jgi:putative membrane protein